MESIIEIILELVLEGSIEASKSSKIPKPVRYLITAMIVLLFIAFIGFIFWVGVIVLNDNIPAGIFLILIFILFLTAPGNILSIHPQIRRSLKD